MTTQLVSIGDVPPSPATAKTEIFPQDERLIPARVVREFVGGIGDMTLWRWQRVTHLPFPRPYIKTAGRNYWRLGDVRNWMRERARDTAVARQSN